ncbi:MULTISPECIES: dihydrofolate reductase [Microbacterium]|jgi:dihydrofolate reductase|uniref:Dihydrofolate reductase n=1 Tax=Microbacterium paraoxydans TaxID=199592 RepID=A0ABZ2HTJ7_9MICO|nr:MULTISPECIES: dihydrofolate reductase [Microbacterium]KYJ99354.1 dihydrofolate reductase [Microbacterium sp. CH1]MCT1394130.1 dihydrofolate reductase [Microbacterium sp. p3-SID338]MPT14940.1 dihydrofolate reductase [Microbacterium sp.]OSO98748.1 dihydrofolate reductase [Microbacterium sp. LEMMJ01]PMC01926.1 dihydrofolate reductase [Microbacterium sp. UMB0228]
MTWVGLIWAEAAGGVIGAEGGMPWYVPEDLAHFKETTQGAPVVMGRKTWDSLPERFRPLPGRDNIVVTRQQDWTAEGARRASTVSEAVRGQEKVWIIGGAEIFRQVIADADRLEVTELDLTVDGDTFAPPKTGWRVVDEGDWQTSRTGVRYRFLRYER